MSFNETIAVIILFCCTISVIITGNYALEWLEKNIKTAVKKVVIYVAQTYVSHKKNNNQGSVTLSKNNI